MDDRPALDFEAAWDVASTIPGWLRPRSRPELLFDAARDLPPSPSCSRSAATRASRRSCWRRPLGAAAVASSRSTRSSTAGSSAARPPATSSRATSGQADADRHRGAAPRVQHPAPDPPGRATSTTSTSTASTTTGRLTDDLQVGTPPARRRAGAGPRLLLLDRRDPRGAGEGAAVAHSALRAPGGLAGPVPGGHPDCGRPACGSCARSRGGCATSPSRCCCGCGCVPLRPRVRAREPVRPVLSPVPARPPRQSSR